MIRVVRAEPEHDQALQRFFEQQSGGCFCQWWQFGGDKNDWQLRCASQRENAAALHDALEARAPEALGFLAFQETEAIGWLKLSPAQQIPKLYEQRLYRKLPCFEGDRSGVFTIGCMLVAEQHRRTGIARALLRHAIDWARSNAGRTIEAFPHRSENLHAAGLWLGPVGLYQEFGFQIAHDFGPYPVLCLKLRE